MLVCSFFRCRLRGLCLPTPGRRVRQDRGRFRASSSTQDRSAFLEPAARGLHSSVGSHAQRSIGSPKVCPLDAAQASPYSVPRPLSASTSRDLALVTGLLRARDRDAATACESPQRESLRLASLRLASLRLVKVGSLTPAFEVKLESASGDRANEYAEESKDCRRHPKPHAHAGVGRLRFRVTTG